MKLFFLFVCIMAISQIGVAQNGFTSYSESEIALGYNVTSRYSHSFSVENRNIIYENSEFTYTVKQIDFSHVSSLLIAGNKSIGIGIKYRFREIFNSNSEDELRFLQQIQWKNLWKGTSLKSRLRMEERFYSSNTKYRVRYRIATSILLKPDLPTFLNAESESLLQLSIFDKPEYEQRFTTTYNWLVTENTQIELGLQYRLENFTQNLGHELFIVAGLGIDL